MTKELRSTLKKVEKLSGTLGRFYVTKDGYHFSGDKKIEGDYRQVLYRYYRNVTLALSGTYPLVPVGLVELPIALLEIGEVEKVYVRKENNASVGAQEKGIDTISMDVHFDNGKSVYIDAAITFNGTIVSEHWHVTYESVQELRYITPYNGIAIDVNAKETVYA
jgi:hypothetical protein